MQLSVCLSVGLRVYGGWFSFIVRRTGFKQTWQNDDNIKAD